MKMSVEQMSVAWFCGMLVAGVSSFAQAEKPKTTATVAGKETPVVVDMFEAIKSGDLEVKLILKDSKSGNAIFTNKSKQPLSIKLPDAFAGVPVAAQFGGGGLGGGGLGGGGGGLGGGGGGGNQGAGGGFGGGGGGQGGFGGGGGGLGGGGGGGGFFKVEPEKARKLKVVTVCLEHGKEDPNPRVQYEIRPIESFTTKPEVIELVKMLGRGELDQQSAQAAAWNLANGLSWQELATKIGATHLNGSTELYFNRDQLEHAVVYVRESVHRASEVAKKTPGKVDSLSNQ